MKSFFKSKTILGVATTVFGQFLPVLAPIVGLDFTAQDGQAVISGISDIVTGAGVVLTVFGRVVASGPLTLFGKSSGNA